MNSKVRVMAMTMLALSLSIFLTVIPARAYFAPAPRAPGTQWVPSGPMIDQLRFQVYTDSTAEFNDFLSGGLDLADALVPFGSLGTFQTDPSSLVTGSVNQFNIYGIDFNMTNTFWGVPFGHGNDPTGRSTNIRQGIAHLISRDGFISQKLIGAGKRADCFAPVLQLAPTGGGGQLQCPLPSQPLVPANGNIPSWNVCSWDRLFPNCSSAYSLGSSQTGAVSAGSADFCAAADHFIAAGLATSKNADCTLTNHLVGAASSDSVTMWVPFKESGKELKALGDILTSVINQLFGRPDAVVECNASATGLDAVLGADSHFAAPNVLGQPPTFKDLLETINRAYFIPTFSNCSTWHMAVLGWGLSQNFDQFYAIYNSKFSFNAYANPALDHWTNMLEFNTTLGGAQQSAQSAEYIMGADAANIPVWSDDGPFVYRNGWTNVVNQLGVGTPNLQTTLNTWNPQPPQTGTLRWGFEESTVKLNPFTSLNYWDRFVLGEIYDTLSASDPYSPNNQFGWLTNSFAQVNPTDIRGVLNADKFWHDLVQLTASDVKFSLLNLAGSALDISDVNVISSPPNQPTIFDIILLHPSPFAMFNIGSIPIIPQHIWAVDPSTACTTKGTAACSVNMSLVTGPSSDPVTNHLLIGSGPFECVDLTTGQVGGGCTVTASGGPGTASVDANGRIILQREGVNFAGTDSLHRYHHGSAVYKLFQWADLDNDGTVDVLHDLSSVESCAGKPATTSGCSHWDTPAAKITCISTAGSCNSGSLGLGGNNDGTVDGAEVSQAESMGLVTWLPGVSYSSLVGAQPIPQTLYEGGIVYAPCTATPPAC